MPPRLRPTARVLTAKGWLGLALLALLGSVTIFGLLMAQRQG